MSNDADRVSSAPQPVRESFGTRFFRLFGGSRVTLDETAYEALEEALILADVGVTATTRIVERLRQRSRRERITDRATLVAALREEIVPNSEVGSRISAPGIHCHAGCVRYISCRRDRTVGNLE